MHYEWNSIDCRMIKQLIWAQELTLQEGGLLKPTRTKMANSLLGAWNGRKKGFYSIFVVSGDKFQILKFFFFAFFEAKMTKIVILDQKLIVPNDYLQFWAHFEWFLSLFQISEVK